ncbi:MAG: glutarate dioxygenase GlaH [Planctomycetota bacterium]|nr:glutarate dioxygenase GlaH [Planctomycetota bacterium]
MKLQKKMASTHPFHIHPSSQHQRLMRIDLDAEGLHEFLSTCSNDDAQALGYVPFLRFITARRLSDTFGAGLADSVKEIHHDRAFGGLTLGLPGPVKDVDACLKLATAVAHWVGTPNFDAMTGEYYAQFAVRDVDDSDSYLRQAYRNMTLHTDGTYTGEPTDWILMMKSAEENAAGGRSRLLHLDDWEDLSRFRSHPMAEHAFLYKSPPSKNVGSSIRRPTFYEQDGHPCLAFIDQFAYPETIEEAEFLFALSQSLENSTAVKSVSLEVGELVLLNNHFWVHGREAFQKHTQLYRELIRLRGRWFNT